MDDEFLEKQLNLSIEKYISSLFRIASIMNEFDSLKRHQTQLF
jgi:hypothetical protein